MADQTKIEWTDATWNPVRGCTRESEGCRNCYAEIMAARFSGPGQWGEGLARMVTLPDGSTDHRWTGKVIAAPDKIQMKPLTWKKPRRIFVNSTSDLFHESLPDQFIDRMFAVMALCPQHTFQVLTKRPARMREYTVRRNQNGHHPAMDYAALIAATGQFNTPALDLRTWPLPNVWMGVSVEDQATANARIPDLLATQAAIRWVSYEPALGPVDWDDIIVQDDLPSEQHMSALYCDTDAEDCAGEPWGTNTLDWIVAGGESGPHARPAHPDWFRQTRDQCAAAGVPFLFKQWGAWEVVIDRDRDDPDWRAPYGNHIDNGARIVNLEGGSGFHGERVCVMHRAGKKTAGRFLDGRLHDEFPEPTS